MYDALFSNSRNDVSETTGAHTCKYTQVQLVTNVFSKTREGWKLTRHHASDRDVPSQKGGSGGSTTPSLVGGNKGQGASDNSILSHFVDENGGVTELSAKIFKVTDGELK